MSINDIITWINEMLRQHKSCIIPIVFFLAFSESLVFFSLLMPATVILLALGVLLGENHIAFWPIWTAATIGAFLGDWISYSIGYHYQNRVIHMWPLSHNPQLLTRGYAFFKRWGLLGIFISRFFGPLRAVVPLIGGIYGMPQRYFQLANIISAMIWAFSILAPGVLGIKDH